MAETAGTPNVSQLQFSRSPEFRSFFSDVHRVRIGNGTVSITFSATTHEPSLSNVGNIIEEQAELLVSWTQLKIISLNLTALVAAIEEEISHIPIPTSFRINMEANRLTARSLGFPPKSGS